MVVEMEELQLLLSATPGGRMPAPPDPGLDPYLDAAAACFARHGIRRTTVPDIVREVGKSRTSVYRQVGSVDQMARLLLARELHRLLAILPGVAAGAEGPDTVIRLAAAIAGFTSGHPVTRKVLNDEPDLVAGYLASALPDLIAEVTTLTSPLLEGLMDRGLIARRDPRMLADFLVRITASLIVAPPPDDLVAYLRETLLPVLCEPTGDRDV